MTKITKDLLYANRPLQRDVFLTLLKTGLAANEYRFARLLATDWLEEYPGDLEIDFLRAKAMALDGYHEKALPHLKRIVNSDPEYLEAQKLLFAIENNNRYPTARETAANLVALGDSAGASRITENWAKDLLEARQALQAGEQQKTEQLLMAVLSNNANTPLAAITHLQFMQASQDWNAARNQADFYHGRWPDSIACLLIFADLLMMGGEEQKAVSLLHRAVQIDITGRVGARLWGNDHPYANLWPRDLAKPLGLQIPSAVSGALGWNQLPRGAQKTDGAKTPTKQKPARGAKDSPETLRSIQAELEKVAERMQKPHFGRSDGRFPAYVILTTRDGLQKKYGAEAIEKIERAMQQIAAAVQASARWSAHVVYADDEGSTAKFGISPAKAADPWSIKKLLHDLDSALSLKGERIGALLIAGGPGIVPFHHLPNPVDDVDTDVPSDNPYATLDEDYFIPMWPVGRLPDDAGNNAEGFLYALGQIAARHMEKIAAGKGLGPWVARLLEKFFVFRKIRASFGYTAEIWQRASHSVFRVIGGPRGLAISPPADAEQAAAHSDKAVHLGYYNLHGLADSPEWFGQRDPLETSNGPDYPIALRPGDIKNSGRAPEIVFTEACYGAHIFNKTAENAIALKFIASGSQAVIGSTCTSYGSITTPLIAADLLGQVFWKLLREGYSAGEALRRAKVYFAREMHRRQGYLDGEDQKTLIQFVLYGDPLAVSGMQTSAPKTILRPKENIAQVKTICDRANGSAPLYPDISGEVLAEVKSIMREHLPGMQGAKATLTQEHIECEGHTCPSSQLGAKSHPQDAPHRRVVTLSKRIPDGGREHPSFARVTLDEKGTVVKLAVSR